MERKDDWEKKIHKRKILTIIPNKYFEAEYHMNLSWNLLDIFEIMKICLLKLLIWFDKKKFLEQGFCVIKIGNKKKLERIRQKWIKLFNNISYHNYGLKIKKL